MKKSVITTSFAETSLGCDLRLSLRLLTESVCTFTLSFYSADLENTGGDHSHYLYHAEEGKNSSYVPKYERNARDRKEERKLKTV